ncbi:MAG: YjjG family noncanonical pyrimidine nucleotidase [Acidimicrobiia bacterium]
MPYTTLLFDIDHTLFDFDASESAAFAKTLAAFGVADPAAHVEQFTSINSSLWKAVERHELSPNDVRTLRFERLIGTASIDADPNEMANRYVSELGANGDLLPGARTLLDALEGSYPMAIVSNGIGEVQRSKIGRLDIGRYFDAIVISGEVGTSKPGSEIFEIAFDRLGSPKKSATLMVGDSLTSDIEGGNRFGIDTCWVTTPDAPASDLPTYRIHDLDQVVALAGG